MLPRKRGDDPEALELLASYLARGDDPTPWRDMTHEHQTLPASAGDDPVVIN